MALVNDLSNLAKQVFGPNGLPNLVPDFAVIQQDVKFSQQEKLGAYFEMAVRLGLPKGVTFAKGDGTAGAFDLNDPVAGSVGQAQVYGYQIMVRDQLSNEDAAKLVKAGPQGFASASSVFYEGQMLSIRRYLEIEFLYGQAGLSLTSGAGTVVSATSHIVNMNDAYWADGIWAGALNDKIQFYTGSTLISSGADSIFTVSAVDFEDREITVTGTSTGITALISALGSGALTPFFYGAKGNEQPGIHTILTASSGNIFNISTTAYPQWHGIQYAAGSSSMSFAKAKALASRIMAQGGLMEGGCLYINHKNWDDLVDDIVAVQRDKLGNDKVKVGVKEVTFTTPAGDLVIKAHAMVWEGFGYLLAKPSKYWKRVGATDVTTQIPGFGEDMFFPLQSKAGVENRVYTHQAIFTEALAKSGVITGLVPSNNA